ncbi:NAD(P)-dependent dehydrogenase (short-subunit alcohol dehydrogenase family) [Streptomyces sp. LBL]|uniref:SDR family NAD(P)-dependent oxidoreductase n=1 Tax=Streptomyces sp. LBL TaxID=2940562 RepID=UPI002476DD83|nr:SDR family NAD(P)-dependent oxidoreductase [Streptomyces sp. LBL]MDH6630256.1 NAD(P)-dependent dehydrogenase (short-subunit alcohol dehydrogenase family) [Streptomyces sp. LBL]
MSGKPADQGFDVGGHTDGHGTRLAGRAALVTGAGSAGGFLGTGAATAILLAAQGATVGILDIDAERAEHTRGRIENDGGRAFALAADITDEMAARDAVDDFAARAGRLDSVVNNAGISGEGALARTTRAGWDRVFALNVTAAMQVSRAAHPHLVRVGGGSVVNISSIAALRGFGSGAYGASKGALQSMSVDLAYSWGRDNVRVNCLVPGHLHTPIGDHGGEEGRQLRRAANLLGVEGTAWDLAWAVLFLASAESRWITGTVIPVDAGTTTATVLGMLPRLADRPGGTDRQDETSCRP